MNIVYPEPNFKVGDKVIVTDRETMSRLSTPCVVVDAMLNYSGREVTISELNAGYKPDPDYARYYIEEDGGEFFWDERLLYLVEHIEPASSGALEDFLLGV